MLKKIKIIGSKINDFSMLDEIEKYLLEIFGDKTNALKLNKDFMKSLKKK